MKKYFIDAIIGATMTIFLIIVLPLVLSGDNWTPFGYDMLQSKFPSLTENFLNLVIVLIIFYLIIGILVFILYSFTPLYKKRHTAGLQSFFFGIISFLGGILFGFFVIFCLAVFSISQWHPFL